MKEEIKQIEVISDDKIKQIAYDHVHNSVHDIDQDILAKLICESNDYFLLWVNRYFNR